MVPFTWNQGFKGRPFLPLSCPVRVLSLSQKCCSRPRNRAIFPDPRIPARNDEIDSQLNRHLSLGLELSFGNFDVVFFPDKLNFFDASQEKFEFLNFHFISKLFIQNGYFFQFSNFKSAVPIYVVNCPCLVIGKMLMLWVKLCWNIMRQKYGQQLSTEHPDFKMAIKSFGTTTPKNIWVNNNFRHFSNQNFNSPVITIFLFPYFSLTAGWQNHHMTP